MSDFTPGPWAAVCDDSEHLTLVSANLLAPSGAGRNGGIYVAKTQGPDNEANARLIAAAPDHADIGWAMCVAAGRWEPWGDGRGEFVLNGIRFSTKLDVFGVPEVTPPLRLQIAKARGDAQ